MYSGCPVTSKVLTASTTFVELQLYYREIMLSCHILRTISATIYRKIEGCGRPVGLLYIPFVTFFDYIMYEETLFLKT